MTIPTVPRWQSALRSVQMAKNPLPFLDNLLREHGETVQLYLGGLYKMIITADPDFVQHILQKNHKLYKKSDVHFEKISHFLGKGLLTSEGDYWLRQRRLIQPGFHKARLKSILQLMDRVCDEKLNAFDLEIATGDKVIDINHKMMELTFSIIAHSIFSININTNELDQLSESLTTLQRFIIKLIRQPYMAPIVKMNGQMKKHEAIRDQSNAIILNYINERRRSGKTEDDLIQMLLDIRYEDTVEGMTDKQLIDEANILFVAGHETSANALAWTWYLLAQYPEVIAKLRQEAQQIIGDKAISFEHIIQLEYFEQVLNESMRLYPPAWTTNRIAIDDDEFKGLKIKKGTVFATYINGVHHSEKHWDQPYTFNPDRFKRDNQKKRHPFAFIPFGGGPRLCIGYQFALMEMKLILLKMITRYDMELVANQKVEPQPLITLRPANGILMKINKL